jgi:hypothetical protein
MFGMMLSGAMKIIRSCVYVDGLRTVGGRWWDGGGAVFYGTSMLGAAEAPSLSL